MKREGASAKTLDPVMGILLALMVFVTFGPALGLPFNYDDIPLIRDNAALGSWSSLAQLAGPRYYGVFGVGNYHPLPILAWAALRALFGPTPWPFHLLSLLLHAANALLVLRLSRRLQHPVPFLPAFLWALTPLHCQALFLGAFLPDLSCAFFALLWINRLLERDPSRDIPGYALFLAALLCKETAAILPLALLALRGPSRDLGRSLRGYLLLLASYAVFRLARIGDLEMLAAHHGGAAEPWHWPLLRLATAFQLCVWPHPLSLMRSAPRLGYLLSPSLTFSAALFAFALTLLRAPSLKIWARRPLAWFVVFLLPFLNLLPLGYARGYFTGRFLNERYLYLASLGVAWTLSAAWIVAMKLSGNRLRSALGLLACLLLLAGAGESWHQALYYQEPETLWAHVVEVSPDSLWARDNYGVALLARGRPGAARREFLAARNLPGASPFELGVTWANLGAAELALGDAPAAARAYRQAAHIDPSNAEAAGNLPYVERLAAARIGRR